MPRDWKDLTDDEILNYEDAQTAQIARYARISERRTQEALRKVENELTNLTDSKRRSGNLS